VVGLRASLCALAFCVCAHAAGLKHLRISTEDHVVVDLAATSIETEAAPASASGQSPVVVHLKGNVEIRMRWQDTSPERLVMHADAAEFHEDTGEVNAHGNVSVTPVKEPEAGGKSPN
jgi:lipopolysaccharide assembly outer membrane protein LptD (OstA)